MKRVAVIGAGSWGTALAAVLAKKGHDVHLWAFEAEVAEQITQGQENTSYLSGVDLPENLRSTADLESALEGAEVVVSVSPAQVVGSVMAEAAPHIADDALVLSASKGIETTTLRRMDEVISEVLSPAQMARFTVLSGPSFALEVAKEIPTAVVAASDNSDAALAAQDLFQTEYFRVYTGSDVIGVELGGALKNVIALGAGVAAGLGGGLNTLAALITRGLAEMRRLGVAMGARAATFSGLAGMGDLVLTCTGTLSRNRTVGYRLGQGESLEDILAEMSAVAEGVATSHAVHDLAAQYGVEMPIAEEVFGILTLGTDPEQALKNLMQRDPKPEDSF
ncbi:MAG: NAD(P)-dependent glycerol-3-phosphate dehydrogenase [Gemmatimonadetes bacterium]|nr:NAD(P)-dependent glycerol-3-phosphate dehydrogenase [Gemmatimonadota bacterium]